VEVNLLFDFLVEELEENQYNNLISSKSFAWKSKEKKIGGGLSTVKSQREAKLSIAKVLIVS